MTKTEYLGLVIMEECAETQQAMSKLLRFGDNKYCEEDNIIHKNAKELWTEYLQLQAVMEMFEETNTIGHLSEEDKKVVRGNKKKKLLKYMEVSKRDGLLQE